MGENHHNPNISDKKNHDTWTRSLKEATIIFHHFFPTRNVYRKNVPTSKFTLPIRLINVAIDASDLHFASISWHIKPAQLSALFESIKDLQTLFALNFWHQKQNVSLHVLWKNRHLKNKNKQNLT